MIQANTFNLMEIGLEEITMIDSTMIDGGVTAYEVGNAVGKLLIIAATIAAFL